ncbi:armadillo-like helical domain-containing protein 4 [Anguilla anguilla]|uniref:armadillo-like helical domain-containing protein 4 n=1 Tax=Anguilla anguilla TaxID=7936 RepID=UPI0015AE367A|nr:armadillo-like helical domain-containing protein 4 [Anguilla anguilla]
MIGHATVQTLLLVGAGLLANAAVLEKMLGDAEGPAPGSSVDEALRSSPERGPHLGSLSWEEEPGGRFPAESQPGTTEQTVSGSLLTVEKATEIISVDTEMQMDSEPKGATPGTKESDHAGVPGTKITDRAATLGTKSADRATTPGTKVAGHTAHNPQASSTALSVPETSGGEARLSSAEEAGSREMLSIDDGQQGAYSTKTPFLKPPGLPTQTQAEETAESLGPFLTGTLSTDGLELKLTAVPGDVQTSTPTTLEAHFPLTPNSYRGPATTAVGPLQPSPPGEEREPAPSQPLEAEQGVFDITSVSGASQQDGVLEKEGGPLFTDLEAGPTPLSGSVRISARPLDHTVSEDMAFGLDSEGTLFPENLPLLFEPLDDVDPEVMATMPPGGSLMTLQPSSEMQSEVELVDLATADADPSISDESLPAPSDSLSLPWQMSGSEIPNAVSTPVLLSLTAPPSDFPPKHGSRNPEEYGAADAATESHPIFTNAPPPSATGQTVLTTVAKTTGLLLPKPMSGLEELEYEEEHDEEEEDEDTEDSEEDESQEEDMEPPVPPPTPPAYSRIPRPPLWVQRNHGLVRSWVEKIRDEAGYVSGMLAPVGIGIAGALVILGILYSIRAVHRKRRNNIKQQRRKQRQMTSRQDQAMLLADSSEDEL